MPTFIRPALIGTLLVALAGCSFTAPGARAATNPSPNPREQALQFAQCMRQHGITDFPDPGANGETTIQFQPGQSSTLDPSSSTFQAAQEACKKYLPSGGANRGKPDKQTQERALTFSQCMREHGITDFPDPSFQNGGAAIQLNPGGNTNLDPNSAEFQAAQQACASILGLPNGGKGTTTGGGGGPQTITGGKP